MALFGMAPVVMKPTALTLNIIVALIGTIRFYRAGFFVAHVLAIRRGLNPGGFILAAISPCRFRFTKS